MMFNMEYKNLNYGLAMDMTILGIDKNWRVEL